MTVFIVSFAVLILILCTAYICYRMAFAVPKGLKEDPYRIPDGPQYDTRKAEMTALVDGVVPLGYRDVFTTSKEGLQLHGRYYERTPGAPIQIMFHGYQSNALRDFCGGLQLALNSGHNALLVDQRAHGQSGGSCLTFGVKEREDCLAWVNFVNQACEEPVPIVLVGISMGAATVLMASEQSLPENVVGIISDCGYSSPPAIIKKVLHDRHYPIPLFYPLLRLGAALYGHFDLEKCSAKTALTSCRIPVLFIHGEDDRFVPCEMSRENYESCASEKHLLTVPGAGHGLCYLVDRDAYCSAVRSFLGGIGILHTKECRTMTEMHSD